MAACFTSVRELIALIHNRCWNIVFSVSVSFIVWTEATQPRLSVLAGGYWVSTESRFSSHNLFALVRQVMYLSFSLAISRWGRTVWGQSWCPVLALQGFVVVGAGPAGCQALFGIRISRGNWSNSALHPLLGLFLWSLRMCRLSIGCLSHFSKSWFARGPHTSLS